MKIKTLEENIMKILNNVKTEISNKEANIIMDTIKAIKKEFRNFKKDMKGDL